MKEANKAILIDDGYPTLLETMNADFIRLLQGALVLMKGTHQPSEKYDEYNLNPNRIKARNAHGEDVMIKLSDYIKMEAN